LLSRQWALSQQWVAAWLDAHPFAGPDEVTTALAELIPRADWKPASECLKLTDGAFLVAATAPIGNVFIVALRNGHYQVAWSTGQTQHAAGEQARILAGWRAEHARHGGRGPYWAASGSAGPVIPGLGKLPGDVRGRARFYINGIYQQSAGGTVGAQTSVWLWDGTTARLQIARAYAIYIDQAMGTRVEGDCLKVREKKFFRSFSMCGGCEERQTDWIVRIAPNGIEDLGERSAVPELDAVDALIYRIIHQKPASKIAAPAVITVMQRIVGEARALQSRSDWARFPTLGMVMSPESQTRGDSELLCLSTDAGELQFRFKTVNGVLFIAGLEETACEPSRASAPRSR
jgi:hypothetical protein